MQQTKNTTRVFNFSAGPATLPLVVLEKIQAELLNWHNCGMSVMELSHRSSEFKNIVDESQKNIRELMQIPKNYHVLFLQGGGRSQFAMIPMNILGDFSSAAYVDNGIWSQIAIAEAKIYTNVNVVASGEGSKYKEIPTQKEWRDFSKDAYLYYVDNETVNGIEYQFVPETGDVPLVSDMSSNILSRPFDVSKYGIIFACAQKNLGTAGITMVIIRDDLLNRSVVANTPSMFRFQNHVNDNSLYNTAPTFSWYVVNEVLKWVKAEGGLAALAKHNATKAKKLYDYIDASDFYFNDIDSKFRSRMNVVFRCKTEELDDKFEKQAQLQGLTGLKGHRYVGGLRASIYNAMPQEGIDALLEFMDHFAKSH